MIGAKMTDVTSIIFFDLEILIRKRREKITVEETI